ncbi:tetratricopeptide repeat protein [Roseateles sp.]|uniref:tetratricopeptide repeat protein n=1 Tax=Roseateles sp. TaxID=1971397 RepID=UPI0039E7C96D
MTRDSALQQQPFSLMARLGAGLVLAAVASLASAQTLPAACGTLRQSWGPFDYRPERYIPETTYRSHAALLAIVEHAHFTPEVENLIRGKTGALPGGDLSYTLGVFPNHHRALIAVSTLALKLKSPQPPETRFSVDCYFRRAMAFRPDDPMVRMVYANYLIQLGEKADAEQQIDAVAATNPDGPLTLRNIALLYFDAKNYDKSLQFVHKAAATGLNVDIIKSKLQQAGQWKDAPPTAADKPASTPGAEPSAEPQRRD